MSHATHRHDADAEPAAVEIGDAAYRWSAERQIEVVAPLREVGDFQIKP
jgi:hypothetical protein